MYKKIRIRMYNFLYLYTCILLELLCKNSIKTAHHPLHAKILTDKANEVDVPSKTFIPAININTTENESIEDFIFRLTR